MKTLILLLLLSPFCLADSIPFAYQSSGSVSLAGNPLLGPTLRPSSGFGNQLIVAIPFASMQGPVSFTMTLGSTVETLTYDVLAGTEVIGFALPGNIYHPESGTFSYQGQSYAFTLVEPVPENATWVMWLTGFVLLSLFRLTRNSRSVRYCAWNPPKASA